MIVRLGGEIGIKGDWTRRTYEKLLLKNMKNALKHERLPYDEFERKRGRIYVRTSKPADVAQALSHVLGISSVSPAKQTTSDEKTISKIAGQLAGDVIKPKTTFAVRCRRVGTQTYTSMDICRNIGSLILTRFKKRQIGVNLTEPDATICIEIRESRAYVYSETLEGPNGFPVGSQAKAICLLSGGIDSPVACWLAMKRGCPITPIYLDASPITDDTTTARALETAKALFEWSRGYPRRIYVIPHGQNLQRIAKDAPEKLVCLLCKRIMYRIAERIAEIENAQGIVTGDAIGEQASQTFTNLRALNDATESYPIHRPLLGFDKTETEMLARKIGTFDISIRKAKNCCAAPNQPATQAKLEIVRAAEANLPIEQMVTEAVRHARIIIV